MSIFYELVKDIDDLIQDNIDILNKKLERKMIIRELLEFDYVK